MTEENQISERVWQFVVRFKRASSTGYDMSYGDRVTVKKQSDQHRYLTKVESLGAKRLGGTVKANQALLKLAENWDLPHW